MQSPSPALSTPCGTSWRPVRAAGSPGRGCCSPTAARSPRGDGSRPSAGRWCAGRRSARSSTPAATITSTSPPPTGPWRPTGCSEAFSSSGARCSTSSAGSTRGFDCTARTSTSSTVRCARDGSAGTSRPPSCGTSTRRSPTVDGSPAARCGTGAASCGSCGSIPRGCARVSTRDKYAALADGFAEHEYADPKRYSTRRAEVIAGLGPAAQPGDTVLDLCCADGIMAAPLTSRGLVYTGVDATEEMIAAARKRNPGLDFVVGRMEDYEPPEPVDLTICLRSFYLAEDRVAFFRRVRGYTRKKFVFDFRPMVFPVDGVLSDLREAGFSRIELRPVLPAAAEGTAGSGAPASLRARALRAGRARADASASAASSAARPPERGRASGSPGGGWSRSRGSTARSRSASRRRSSSCACSARRARGGSRSSIATADFLALLVWLTSDDALVKYGFRYAANGEWGRFHRLIRVAFVAELAASLVATALIVAIAPFADSIFHQGSGLEAPLVIAALLPPLQALESIAAATLILGGPLRPARDLADPLDGAPACRDRARRSDRRDRRRRRSRRRPDAHDDLDPRARDVGPAERSPPPPRRRSARTAGRSSASSRRAPPTRG